MVWGSVAIWTSQCVVMGGDLQWNRALRDVVDNVLGYEFRFRLCPLLGLNT